jgi:hypothetical protein
MVAEMIVMTHFGVDADADVDAIVSRATMPTRASKAIIAMMTNPLG